MTGMTAFAEVARPSVVAAGFRLLYTLLRQPPIVGFIAVWLIAGLSAFDFSLIFVARDVTLGHMSQEALGLVALAGLVTIAASTCMINWSQAPFALRAVPGRRQPCRRDTWRSHAAECTEIPEIATEGHLAP
ncbi:hypothetical protein LAZ29_11340 [Cereibacter sphaeroides]|uniref:hypothetical protein n=1 Tax=Cereibacter sphaeroides TaxID=1063 RepID=UPI001F335819|nr:hypothetical protein [Cereibacter sphaeroides]MCE6951526.1 hypothetical protein [Cereibacter sphaeroides]